MLTRDPAAFLDFARTCTPDFGPATAKAMGMELDEMIAMFAADSAIKRPNTVEEVAAVAVLLASAAGAGITGQQISVDGGTAQY